MNYRKSNNLLTRVSLQEDTRTQLISKSKASPKGRERYAKKNRSRVATTVKQYNSIDMNKLFKDNILTVDVRVQGETDDYVVRISYGGFLDFLHEELARNNNTLDLRAITRALVRGFNQDNVYVHCSCPDFCLHGDTTIKLLGGNTDTIRNIVDRVNNGENLVACSISTNGDFSPSRVISAWCSGYARDFITIELENGKTVTTTPNHKYLLCNGKYVEAGDLIIGDKLMGVDQCHIVVNSAKTTFANDEPVYDIQVETNSNFLVDAGVILHNCYRFAYWATRNKINSGEPQLSNGKWERNPDDKLGSACKHVLLVLSNNFWVIKIASVIKNYVEYIEKHMKKAYADIIYPAIYREKYKEPIQTSVFDDDELDSGEETIDISNEQGRTKGQFKQGNEYRFKPKETSKDQLSIEDTEEIES